MRNNKIINSWDKIKPDNATHERILGNILDRVQTKETQKGKVKNMVKKPYWKILAPIAACLIIAVAVAVPMLLNNGENNPILDPSNGIESFVLSRSSGNIQVRYTDDVPNMPSMSASLAHMTEEELITLNNTDIFSGTIQSVRNIEIDFNGDILYKGMATILVDEVFRGSCVTGNVVSILLDNTFSTNMWVEDNDVTEKMVAGMAGIFMPLRYDETSPYSFYERNGEKICWLDVAQYRFSDGTRYAFLETQDGLLFARWAYESIENATTLDEIKQYINTMLEY